MKLFDCCVKLVFILAFCFSCVACGGAISQREEDQTSSVGGVLADRITANLLKDAKMAKQAAEAMAKVLEQEKRDTDALSARIHAAEARCGTESKVDKVLSEKENDYCLAEAKAIAEETAAFTKRFVENRVAYRLGLATWVEANAKVIGVLLKAN